MKTEHQFGRRTFLGGLFASAGFGLISGCRVFEAPAGWQASGKPRLKFGVLSDLHVRIWRDGVRLDFKRDTRTFRKALEYFKSQGVDAVVIAGDIADRGFISELQAVADVWFEVFPEGCGVEKIFVAGNHDLDGWDYDHGYLARTAYPDEAERARQLVSNDFKAAWKRVFHEDTDSIFMKTVKGYRFIGQHWDRHDLCEAGRYGELLKPFLAKHAAELTGKQPFFYVQHPHLANTVFGPWAWGHDDGETTKALSAFPNAVAFSGHSHFSETDERAIWQGGFTSLCCSSLRYTGLIDCLRGEVKPDYENGFQGCEGTVMKRYDSDDGQQGLLVTVYEDAVVYARRDLRYNRALGPDWVQPLDCPAEAFAFAPRKAKEVPPAFPSDAVIETDVIEAKKRAKGRQKMKPAFEIAFPAANAGGTRPYGYRVTVTGVKTEEPLVRYVLAQGYNMPLEDVRAQEDSFIVLATSLLPEGSRLTISVEPFTSFGNFGAAISTTVKRPEK